MSSGSKKNKTLFVLILVFTFMNNAYADNYPYSGWTPNNPSCSSNHRTNSGSQLDEAWYLFTTPGTWPTGLTFDGEYLWNQDTDTDTIYKLTFEGQIVSQFRAPGDASGGLAWVDSVLYAVDEELAYLYKIDPVTGTVIGGFQLPNGNTNSWGVCYDGEYIWVTQYSNSCHIFKLDPDNGQILFSFTPPNDDILGIAWDGQYLCATDCQNDTLFRFDPNTGFVIERIPWDIPYSLGLCYDGENLYNVSGKIQYGGTQSVYKIIFDTALTMTINPMVYPNSFPQSGGRLNLDLTIHNELTANIAFEIWSDVVIPSGRIFGPIVYHNDLDLDPGETMTWNDIIVNIPGLAPGGNYLLKVNTGYYPDSVITYEVVSFAKQGTLDSYEINSWEITGLDERESIENAAAAPAVFNLLALPNPFNNSTTISFDLAEAGEISLKVYDIGGREVAEFGIRKAESGKNSVVWDAGGQASGVYFVRVVQGNRSEVKKVVLMK